MQLPKLIYATALSLLALYYNKYKSAMYNCLVRIMQTSLQYCPVATILNPGLLALLVYLQAFAGKQLQAVQAGLGVTPVNVTHTVLDNNTMRIMHAH